MQLLTRTVHVLSLGLWFGTCVFFLIVGFSLFQRFETLGADAGQRPPWFPLPPAHASAGEPLPEGLEKEQGTRAAGFAVGPLFDWYYAIQSVCGAAALVTALTWARLSSNVPVIHKVRVVVLLVAVTGVAAGWWLEGQVHDLAEKRDAASDVLLSSRDATAEQQNAWVTAKAEFGRSHGWSMTLNLVTVIAVAVAMGLAAQLPQPVSRGPVGRPT